MPGCECDTCEPQVSHTEPPPCTQHLLDAVPASCCRPGGARDWQPAVLLHQRLACHGLRQHRPAGGVRHDVVGARLAPRPAIHHRPALQRVCRPGGRRSLAGAGRRRRGPAGDARSLQQAAGRRAGGWVGGLCSCSIWHLPRLLPGPHPTRTSSAWMQGLSDKLAWYAALTGINLLMLIARLLQLLDFQVRWPLGCAAPMQCMGRCSLVCSVCWGAGRVTAHRSLAPWPTAAPAGCGDPLPGARRPRPAALWARVWPGLHRLRDACAPHFRQLNRR